MAVKPKKATKKKGKKKYLKPILVLILILGIGYTSFLYKDDALYYGSRIYYRFKDFYGFKKNNDQSENLKDFGIKMPVNFRIHGVDVSKHQRFINWDQVSKMRVDSARISFAFIKATEGYTRKDEYFKYNWDYAKRNGIIRGAYHYFRPNLNFKYQIKNFVETVTIEKGDLPPVLDIEEKGNLSKTQLQESIKEWLVLIEEYYAIKPIIYTNISFYRKYINDDMFKDYPVWVAYYLDTEIPITNSIWTFWQHSDKGKVNGIAGNVDLDIFNGSLLQLNKLRKR